MVGRVRSAGRALKTGRANEPNPDLWPKAVARVPPLEFRRAPLLAAVMLVRAGRVIARNWQPPVILLIATLLLCSADVGRSAMVAANRDRATGGGLDGNRLLVRGDTTVPPTQQALASYADGLSRQVRGRVMRVRELPPQQDDSDHDKETGWWPEKEADEEAAASARSRSISRSTPSKR